MEDLKDELRSMKVDVLERNLFDEVMTIKQNVLDKSGDQSERVVLNSLLKLRCMKLSVKILEATMIGKSVSALRNHSSKNVRDIVRLIIKDWRLMVGTWLDATNKNEEKGGDDDLNKNQIVPTSQQKRPMIIRIKLKNNIQVEKESAPKGPVTPELKVRNQGVSSTSSVYSSTNGVDNEVLRIKGILEKGRLESKSVLCDLLRKLQSIELSEKNLQTTGIGKTVSVLKKHASKDVGEIARTLVNKWKGMVNELLNKESKVQVTPSSKTRSLNMERRPQVNSGKTNIQKDTPSIIKEKVEVTKRKQHEEGYKEIAENMQRNPINTRRERKMEIGSIEEKLEATKRKLHANYKEAENTKKKRRIQVMEFHELANEGLLCQTTGRRQIKPLKKPIKRIWSTNGGR